MLLLVLLLLLLLSLLMLFRSPNLHRTKRAADKSARDFKFTPSAGSGPRRSLGFIRAPKRALLGCECAARIREFEKEEERERASVGRRQCQFASGAQDDMINCRLPHSETGARARPLARSHLLSSCMNFLAALWGLSAALCPLLRLPQLLLLPLLLPLLLLSAQFRAPLAAAATTTPEPPLLARSLSLVH